METESEASGSARFGSGFGGWLAFFAIGRILSVVLLGTSLVVALRALSLAVTDGQRAGLYIAVAVEGFTLAGTVAGLFLAFTRNRWTPIYWTVLLFLMVPLHLIDVVVWQDAPGLSRPRSAADVSKSNVDIVRGWIPTLMWLGYWFKSQRVQFVFGSRGLRLFGQLRYEKRLRRVN